MPTVDPTNQSRLLSSAHPTSEALSLRQVSKSFGPTHIVRDLTLHIGRGEFFSLLGPSGTGKTTVLRLIAGFEQPDAGTIEIDGRLMIGVPPNQRLVNTVFQSYALFPHLTVDDNIGFGLQMQGVPKVDRQARIDEALALLKLTPLRTRLPGRLSGGEQQRVAIARAIVNRPAVVLLDEPMAALDEPLRQAMLQELQTIQRRLGTTFVCVTHHQAEALAVSDRVGIMQAGRLVQVGAPQEVYEQPASRFVAEFLGQTTMLSGRIHAASGDQWGLLVDGITEPITVRPSNRELFDGTVATLVVRTPYLVATDAHQHKAGGDSAAQSVAGVIEDIRYAGAVRHYRVRLGDQIRWSLAVPNDGQDRPNGNVGETVRVAWSESQATLLTGADA
ncbi:MAG: ABC transporter ATP-binding protein [Nitrospiraceae bacterium]